MFTLLKALSGFALVVIAMYLKFSGQIGIGEFFSMLNFSMLMTLTMRGEG